MREHHTDRQVYLKKLEFDIKFYDKADGSKPAKDFILGLPPKMRAKVLRIIDMLEINGSELREPYSKHLTDGIFELRAQFGVDISRVLYFFMIGRKAILTHGFIKKTPKTPPAEIEKAKQYRADYLKREEKQK
jgi:phage-related protein